LALTVLLFSVTVLVSAIIAPPKGAEFPLTVVLISTAAPLPTSMPPAWLVAEFPLTVLSMSVSMDSRASIPAPEKAEFPLTVLRISVPLEL